MDDPKADKLQDELDFNLISSNEDCSTTIENSFEDKSMLSQMENSESNDGLLIEENKQLCNIIEYHKG